MADPVGSPNRTVRQARKAASYMQQSQRINDFDRLYDSVQAVVSLSNQNAQDIASLTQVVKAHDERLEKIETSGGRLVPWIGVIVAVVSLLLTAGVDTIVGVIWLIAHANGG